jgi:hypothetical protein
LINLVRLWLEKPPAKSRGLPLLVPHENKSPIRVLFLVAQKPRFYVHVYHTFHHVLTIKNTTPAMHLFAKTLYLATFSQLHHAPEKPPQLISKTTLQER